MRLGLGLEFLRDLTCEEAIEKASFGRNRPCRQSWERRIAVPISRERERERETYCISFYGEREEFFFDTREREEFITMDYYNGFRERVWLGIYRSVWVGIRI